MPYVSVIGGGHCDQETYDLAREVGRGVAGLGAVLICGGLGGVMEAAARGAREAGGVVIGILPGHEREAGNQYLSFALTTGLGHGRNLLVASSGDVVIAVGGEYGTLSEIGLALALNRPVVVLRSWLLSRAAGGQEPLLTAQSAAEAVDLARQALARG
jgi:uncharacterized protein (TIGR00725 family)